MISKNLTRPHCSERRLVKPGLTGWAQVRYPYGQ
jgi:lipopolysaccharide/colanic/teichoic acid biosynthesis glycosyltransferase